jgi:hypothetical protein
LMVWLRGLPGAATSSGSNSSGSSKSMPCQRKADSAQPLDAFSLSETQRLYRVVSYMFCSCEVCMHAIVKPERDACMHSILHCIIMILQHQLQSLQLCSEQHHVSSMQSRRSSNDVIPYPPVPLVWS